MYLDLPAAVVMTSWFAFFQTDENTLSTQRFKYFIEVMLFG